MKARLKTGEIIELEKDCSCLPEIHAGPHWLHMIDFDERTYRQYRDSATATLANTMGDPITKMHAEALLRQYIDRERSRLDDKLREMTSRGIVEIIR